MTKKRLAFEVLGAPQMFKPELDESRNYFALLAWKKGGAPIKKKEKKVKNKKYILMNPAPLRSAPSSCARALPTAAPELPSAGRAGGAPREG